MSNFAKLFKYNARNLFKTLSVFYLLLFVSALLARVTRGLTGSFVTEFVKGFTGALFISMIANLLINNFMRLMVRVRANMYGAESYLTHALPVKTQTIWLSWWAVGLATLFTSCLAVLLAIILARPGVVDNWFAQLEPIAAMVDFSALGLTLIGMLLVGLELFFLVSVGMLAIVLGQKSGDHQVLRAVAYAFGIYWLAQVAIVGTLYALALHNDQLMAVFRDTAITSFNSLPSVMILAGALYTLFTAACGAVAVKCLKRGVNVE